jgi:predicted TIM-barrel fold metal-dependent hydrolase
MAEELVLSYHVFREPPSYFEEKPGKDMEHFNKIYFNTAGISADIDALKFALAKTSSDKILFATDYPHLSLKKIRSFILFW